MLSRIAESLYWVGRYAERAEDIARILDVHFHHILEDPWVDEEMACRTLLGIMGTPAPESGADRRRPGHRHPGLRPEPTRAPSSAP